MSSGRRAPPKACYFGRFCHREEVLDFAIAFDLMIANTFFHKRQSHLVTFSSGQYSSQIDLVAASTLVKSTLSLQEGGINEYAWTVR